MRRDSSLIESVADVVKTRVLERVLKGIIREGWVFVVTEKFIWRITLEGKRRALFVIVWSICKCIFSCR